METNVSCSGTMENTICTTDLQPSLLTHGYKQFVVFCSEVTLDDPMTDNKIISLPTSFFVSVDESDHDDVEIPSPPQW